MRASRLLQMLLMLQNRGRMTTSQLAIELEVTRRTILRDIDALTEAGLPIIAFQGNKGGIELGFEYRTRLTGLTEDELEALALMLAHPLPELHALGLGAAARRAGVKVVESFPQAARIRMAASCARYIHASAPVLPADPRIEAIAGAMRDRRVIRLRALSLDSVIVHPVGLMMGVLGLKIIDARDPDAPIELSFWGNINVLAQRF